MSVTALATATVRVKVGALVLTSPAVTFLSAFTDRVYEVTVIVTCRTAGASATVGTSGWWKVSEGANSPFDIAVMTESGTLDTTGTNALDATIQYGVGVGAGDTITSKVNIWEVLGI